MKRKIVLVAALAAGVAAAVLTRLYLAAKDSEVDRLKSSIVQRYGTIDVLCFKRDTPSGAVISSTDIGYKSVPAAGMRGQAIEPSNFGDVSGRKTLIAHRKGDVLFWADVEGGNPAAAGLSSDIKKNMRAVSINCTGAASVSSMVKPNMDRRFSSVCSAAASRRRHVPPATIRRLFRGGRSTAAPLMR